MALAGKRLKVGELRKRTGGIPVATLNRWARGGEIPGAYVQNHGMKNRWQFPDTPALRKWINDVMAFRSHEQKQARKVERMSYAHRQEYRRREHGKKLGLTGEKLKRFQKATAVNTSKAPLQNFFKFGDDFDRWVTTKRKSVLPEIDKETAVNLLEVRWLGIKQFMASLESIAAGAGGRS